MGPHLVPLIKAIDDAELEIRHCNHEKATREEKPNEPPGKAPPGLTIRRKATKGSEAKQHQEPGISG